MIGLRGLGSTNVQAIAQAQRSGQLANLNFQTEYFQPAYTAAGVLEPLPSYLYVDDSGAGLIASLLNGSVFQAAPPGNYQVAAGAQIPLANWVRLSDGGEVLPGNLVQPGTVLAFQDECDAEAYFANSIPGGQISSDCASIANSNPLIAQNGLPSPALSVAPPPVSIPTPVLPVTPVGAPSQSNGSSALLGNPTPVPGAPPATNPPAANVAPLATATDWTSIFTESSIGGVPNWVWMAGIGVALFAFGGKR